MRMTPKGIVGSAIVLGLLAALMLVWAIEALIRIVNKMTG